MDLSDDQRALGDATYQRQPEMFGRQPSASAVYAARRLRESNVARIVELGAGHGRAVHFFDRPLVDALAHDWYLDDFTPDEEGSLPRRLWRITQIAG